MATITEDQLLELTFDDADVQRFKIDRSRRQLSGLILPWGTVARNAFAKWRFARGSLRWGDVSRVKLLRDHDPTQPVGVALELVDRPDGLHGTLAVARGDAGDQVLSLAEDGVLDGFSAGPRIEPNGWEMDRTDRDVRLVTDARLMEVTVTAFPAFDDARVRSVRMSLVGGTKMADTTTKPDTGAGGATVLEDQETAIKKFRTELDQRFEVLGESLGKAMEAQQEQVAGTIAAAFDSAFQRLQDVGAGERADAAVARFKVIKEPPIYRFDGDVHKPSMVKDSWAYHNNRDYDARDRLVKFQQQVRDLVDWSQTQQFVNTTTAAAVIPPGYRPDLFVTQLMQGRPFAAALSRGTITDATPYTVPRFVSTAGATGDHVEGTNPVPGTMTLDTVTVTPGAISGIFELTREIVDSANPAIDAIALAAMRESWNQQTEVKIYDLLNGADGQAGTITGGFVPSGAQVSVSLVAPGGATSGRILLQTVRRALARYPFNRFATPGAMLLSQEATVDFADARDTTERPLLPSIGAQNSSGLGNAVQQGWSVDGLPAVPAWAITDQGVGQADVFGLNANDAWYWESNLLTFRFEEKKGPANIELALFGYFATHLLRPVGLFAVRHNLT
ncbi:MAG: HK97 family phage prohead protease [Acidimicrobiales bacterium]